MENKKYINVFYNNIHVGILAKKGIIAFEYSDEFLQVGFSISPLSLPLIKKVFIPKDYFVFQGLFGVFNDSLPDGWGRLLVDRFLASKGINIQNVTLLERLAIVSEYGMGALKYKPVYKTIKYYNLEYDLDKLSNECSKILQNENSDNLDELFMLGGSAGGARPKILVENNKSQWIIKFAGHNDIKDSGLMEYEYMETAEKCGIEVPAHKLFPSNICSGYFGVERFDRKDNKKIHIISACALLEQSHRILNLDYNDLMKLTKIITSSMEEVMKMYRLMVFNVLANNLDDHGKNFSYIYDEEDKRYKLSPAYDLTNGYSINNEHATTVCGKGYNITDDDMIQVAKNIDIDVKNAKKIIKEIKENVYILEKYKK